MNKIATMKTCSPRMMNIVILALGVTTVVFFIHQVSAPQRNVSRRLARRGEASLDGLHDRWIVVTSIQYPTDAVKSLASIPGWKMVVVGDLKTPSDWKLEGVVYLGKEDQEALPYTILDHLPWKSYGRKMVGYLYAIEHGAKYIYETDDDNHPMDNLKGFQDYSTQVDALVIQTDNLTYNPCVHFGQSSLWPRGFPLELIGTNQPHSYQLCNIPTPAVQQGFVDGDPDVDALVRLTRKHVDASLDLQFDKQAPPLVFPAGTYTPFNTQNTFFLSSAFWALAFPTTVSFRMCDIYRAYFVEKILSISGQSLAFYPPNLVQIRNPHSFIADEKEESVMYYELGRMVDFLSKWECSTEDVFGCISDLALAFADNGFWGKDDVYVYRAWLADLEAMGYVPPKVQISQMCRGDDIALTYYPWEQKTSVPYSPQLYSLPGTSNVEDVEHYIQNLCNVVIPLSYHDNFPKDMRKIGLNHILLVVHISAPGVIPSLEAYYRPYVPHILYCGESTLGHSIIQKWRVTYLGLPQASGLRCVYEATRMGYRVSGYLSTADTVLLNIKYVHQSLTAELEIDRLHPDRMWLARDVVISNPGLRKKCEEKMLPCHTYSQDNLQELTHTVNKVVLTQTQHRERLAGCVSSVLLQPNIKKNDILFNDIVFYLPSHMVPTLYDLVKPTDLQKHSVHIIRMLGCLESNTRELQDGRFIDETPRNQYHLDVSYSFINLALRDTKINQSFCKLLSRSNERNKRVHR